MLETTKLYLSIILLIVGCIMLLIHDVPPYSTIGKILIAIGTIISLYVILPLLLPLNGKEAAK